MALGDEQACDSRPALEDRAEVKRGVEVVGVAYGEAVAGDGQDRLHDLEAAGADCADHDASRSDPGFMGNDAFIGCSMLGNLPRGWRPCDCFAGIGIPCVQQV